MYNPVSTYRFQFNKDFTLAHLNALLPYLQTLGIKTIYASPIYVAAPESSHGYDNVDPTRINPEIGTHEELKAISRWLAETDMGWVQDIVPNHMAYHPNNEWLMDVLEKGPNSLFRLFFETYLASPFFRGRILAPFLPEPLTETLAAHELALSYERDRFVFNVNGNVLPLKPESYAVVLRAATENSGEAIQQLITEIDQIHHLDSPQAYALAWAELQLQLSSLANTQEADEYITNCLNAINTDLEGLKSLVENQHYKFCTEPESRQEMTYRRFFTINGLICLNVSEESVFEHVHRLTKTLLDEGTMQGLRIDHVDGLFDPTQYLHRLRTLAGDDAYIVVEKILHDHEPLPTDWPIQGTSGYEFLAGVNNLLTDGRNEAAFRDFYHELIGSDTPLSTRVRYRKAYFLAQYMGGELDNLYHYFLALNLADETDLDTLSAGQLKFVIGELLVECPVYRYYGNQFPMPDDEARVMKRLLEKMGETNPNLATAVTILEKALLTKPPVADADFNQRALLFYQRLMQFSGPLMAKGVEDTLMYTYNCFVGHNEVGDSPERFGMAADEFHQTMQERQQQWPLAQNATATHDTKRGEDVRARLNVLTDLADEWLTEVHHWRELNADVREEGGLDPNDTYLMYQNLIGAYPMPGEDEDDFPNRFRLYLEKAFQEAKRHTTGWAIDEEYHAGIRAFTDRLLDTSTPFWARFKVFHREISDFGVVNSLVQTALKLTCPGVPDVYQGCEGWDLSLVDPDNRRPVDYLKRQQWLAGLTNEPNNHQTTAQDRVAHLWQHRFDGCIKFWLTHKLLQERRQHPDLFMTGDYVPLAVEGAYKQHIMAFARRQKSEWRVLIVPLHSAQLCRQQHRDTLSLDWQDTRVLLPTVAPNTWMNCLTEQTGAVESGIRVSSVLDTFPVAILRLS